MYTYVHIAYYIYYMNFLYVHEGDLTKDTQLNTPNMQNTYGQHIISKVHHEKHELYYYM